MNELANIACSSYVQRCKEKSKPIRFDPEIKPRYHTPTEIADQLMNQASRCYIALAEIAKRHCCSWQLLMLHAVP